MSVYVKQYGKEPSRNYPHIFVGFLFLFLSIGSLFFLVRTLRKTETVTPFPKNFASEQKIKILFPKKREPDALKKIVTETLSKNFDTYSVVVQSYTDDFILRINDTAPYTAASINKLPIAVTLYDAVQRGTLRLEDTITVQADDIQAYGTGSIQYEGPGGAYTLRTLTKLMLNESDNTAAHILGTSVLGLSVIQKKIESLGLRDTNMEDNTTTNNDMALLLKKLSEGGIVNTKYTQELLEYMKDTAYEDRLPSLLPKDVDIYHKIGTAIGEIHDIGIVSTPKLTYYVGIMTKGTLDEENGGKIIAETSKKIYDFMTKN
ncbi:serine hydrolase [Candidatus Gottesmanbacteria bacterium]|nr:serine hydrolase [Candidatus Gottesmanbacteria bacterium]